MGNNDSLRNAIDANDKVVDIRLSLRSEIGKDLIWILVEGENDSKIYPKFFDNQKTKVEFVGGGKGQMQIALNVLTQETDKVIGIRDADFCRIDQNIPLDRNLFLTDFHDIEMTMLSSEEVLTNLFIEYSVNNYISDIWRNILNEVSFVGYVRWLNEKNIVRLLFKGLRFGDFVELQDSQIRLKRRDFLSELNQRSQNKIQEITEEIIDRFQQENPTDDFLNLCNGHDVTAFLSLRIGAIVSHKEFCRHLRLAYRLDVKV